MLFQPILFLCSTPCPQPLTLQSFTHTYTTFISLKAFAHITPGLTPPGSALPAGVTQYTAVSQSVSGMPLVIDALKQGKQSYLEIIKLLKLIRTD